MRYKQLKSSSVKCDNTQTDTQTFRLSGSDRTTYGRTKNKETDADFLTPYLPYTEVYILVEGLDLGECVENLEVVNDTIENKNEFIQQYTSDLEHPLVS